MRYQVQKGDAYSFATRFVKKWNQTITCNLQGAFHISKLRFFFPPQSLDIGQVYDHEDTTPQKTEDLELKLNKQTDWRTIVK